MVLFGIDRVAEYRQAFQGRVALITAPSGRTADNRSSIDRLREVCDLRLLLAPEHGVRGDKEAGETFADEIDKSSGLPMVSLYSPGSKRLPQGALDRFDTLVYDIQDVGCRYYTFISTLKGALEDCARAGKRLVVLDRPNPLGGRVEGPVLEEGCRSFVGCDAIPVRYGLTCGEFARMVVRREGLDCDLQVIPCEGLTREMDFPRWGRLWVMPSPSMPRYETALLYPGTCLFEGTAWSEGRGTADPFSIVGAPGVDAEAFTAAFNRMNLPGVAATPAYFVPSSSKHQGKLCGGIHLHITDRAALRPVELGYRLLALAADTDPAGFSVLPPMEGEEIATLSLLAGHRGLEQTGCKDARLPEGTEEACCAFASETQRDRLY